MIIYGIFSRFKIRNEKTGESVFTFKKKDDNYIICKGIVIDYTINTPLKLEGTYNKEEKAFIVSNVCACGYDNDVTAKYLSGKLFNGIGREKALKILSITGVDIFDYIRNNIYDNEIGHVYSILKRITYKEDLYKYISSNHGSYTTMEIMYDKYENNAINEISSNPYSLISAGIPYKVCEYMAKTVNIEQVSDNRIQTLVHSAMNIFRGYGNTRVLLNDLIDCIYELETEADCYKNTSLIILAAEIKNNYIIEHVNDKIYVYDKSDHYNEDCIVKNVKRIMNSAEKFDYKIPEYINKSGLVNAQIQCFNLLKSNGIKIIKGGPGTGKTTTMNYILKEYRRIHPNNKILLCAPTGCAARRLGESTGCPSYTIHSALKLTPFKKSEPHPIDADLIIVDEMSIADAELSAKLFSCIKNNALVIIIGDTDQLPSIGTGDVLKNLIDSDCFEVYSLTEILRQKEDGRIIIENSQKIIHGEMNLLTDKHFKIIRCNTEEEVSLEATKIADVCYKHSIDNFKIYTPSKKRKFPAGTRHMNSVLRTLFHKDKKKTSIIYGENTFCIGDRVMFNENSDTFFNGQEGIISDIEITGENYYITVTTEEGEIRLTKSQTAYIDLAYAITAHKSQGSECDNAIILVPLHPYSMLKRQLLYVEVTRARKNVIIISEDNALEKCISTFGEYRRNTGLTEKLINAFS